MKIKFNNKVKAIGIGIALATSGICSTGCTVTIESPEDVLNYIEVEEKDDDNYVIKIKPTETSVSANPTEEEYIETTTSISNEVVSTISVAPETVESIETTTATTGVTTPVTSTTIVTTINQETTTQNTTTTSLYVEPTTETTYTEVVDNRNLYINNLTVERNSTHLYKCGKNEFLPFISNYFGIELSELKRINNIPSEQDVVEEESYLKIPATIIYGEAKKGDSISNLALYYGVTEEYLCKINDINDVNYIFDNDERIKTYVLPNNQNSYDIAYAKMNIVYNQFVIPGDKILSPHGWAGSSLNILALSQSRFAAEDNDVILYQFDGGNNLYYQHVASNVKDIDVIEDGQVPVIYLRDNYVYGDSIYKENQSYVYNGYDVHFDENHNPILTYNNSGYDLYCLTPELQKVR